jgi:hypothetical protein
MAFAKGTLMKDQISSFFGTPREMAINGGILLASGMRGGSIQRE